MSYLYGEVHFISFASAAVYRSTAPKKHTRGGGAERTPIFLIPHQWVRLLPA
jgi:hypothetical protein